MRDPYALDAWIDPIPLRHTMRQVRHNGLRARREIPLDELSDALEPAGLEFPHDVAERLELAEAWKGAIDLLPPKQRMALVLRYVHDFSHEQIARTMGIRPGTAGALTSRARSALRNLHALEEIDENARGSRGASSTRTGFRGRLR